MFCNKCGKEISENTKFCTSCGAPVQDRQPVAATPPLQPQQQAYPSNMGYQGDTAYQTAAAAPTGSKKTTVAIAAVSAVLVIITMLCGWFTFSIPSSVINAPISVNDFGYSFSVFQITGVTGQADNIMKAAKKEMQRYGSMNSNSELRDIQEIMSKLGTVNVVANTVKILAILAVLALLAFIFMTLIDNKNGAMVGQLGFSLSILTAVIFIIFMAVLNSSITSLMDRFDSPASARDMIKLSSSVWVYFTLILGVAGGAFVTIRKSIIRGY